MEHRGSRSLRVAIGGISALVACQSLEAREFSAAGVPADVVARAVEPLVGFPIKSCTNAPVSGRRDIRTLADAAEFFAGAGLPVSFVGTTLQVGCDAADARVPDTIDAPNIPRGSPLNPFASFGPGGAQPTPNLPPSSAPAEPPRQVLPGVVEIVSAKRVKRSMLDKVANTLGLKLVADDTPDHPILLAGPADAVSIARQYIEAVNVCPMMLDLEASIIQRSDSNRGTRDIGIRIGGKSIGVGPAGVGLDSGLNFSWLTGFLEANNENAKFRVNASHRALLLAGEPVQLRDGGDSPVRAATSVTDRETRTDVMYRSTGFNLDLTLLAIDGDDALIAVDQSFSSLGVVTDLGPSFANRSIKSTMRVPIGKPTLIATSGSDSVSTSKRRGILFWGDNTVVAKAGSFLVFRLVRAGCREEEPATTSGTPARTLKPKNMQGQ